MQSSSSEVVLLKSSVKLLSITANNMEIYNSQLVQSLSVITRENVTNSHRMPSISTTKSKSLQSKPLLYSTAQLYQLSATPSLAQSGRQSRTSARIHSPSLPLGFKYSDNSARTPIRPTRKSISLFEMLHRKYTPKTAASMASTLVSSQIPRRQLPTPSCSSWPTTYSVRLEYGPRNHPASISRS